MPRRPASERRDLTRRGRARAPAIGAGALALGVIALAPGCSLAAPDAELLSGGLACAVGLADCNRDAADGCEVRVARDRAHCGGCGIGCGPDDTCLDGRCVSRCGGVRFLHDDARLSLGSAGYALGEGDFTAEAWARVPFAAAPAHDLDSLIWASRDDTAAASLAFGAGSTWLGCWLRDAAGTVASLEARRELGVGWRHVACQRRGGKLELWLDGELVMASSATGSIGPSAAAVLGRPRWTSGPPRADSMVHDLGPLRISRVARYPARFVPEWRWEVDADTVSQHLVAGGLDPDRLALCRKGGTCAHLLADEAGGDNDAFAPAGVEPLTGPLPCD
ncbi:MAG: hypothetical protein IT376_21605 [Polyangiaceae bacterium]|nr:hypothetical protein [Polyangiaceae bacterium]